MEAEKLLIKQCQVEMDSITTSVAKSFDFAFDGKSSFSVPEFQTPESWGIGVVVGPSGSGKTSILESKFTVAKPFQWSPTRSVVSHFGSEKDAIDRLSACGLNSIPSWCKPYHALSNGERFRADVAVSIESDIAIDEFTSVVDRSVAMSLCVSLKRYVSKAGVTKVVLASCHYDILDWLEPDWVYDTRDKAFVERRFLWRPVQVVVRESSPSRWERYRDHHYLSGSINRSSKCWEAYIGDTPVAFASAIAFPNGNFKNARREHRTVVIPDYQGMGIGVRLSDLVAMHFKSMGCRYFSKTSHPRMGEYRNTSPRWRPTSKNMTARPDYRSSRNNKEQNYKHLHAARVCYSHEFVGEVS